MDASNHNDPRDILRKAYNRYAQDRDSSGIQDWKIQERAAFLELLKQSGKKTLLEIGAGPGRDSKFFQEQGLETVSIDLSPAMVELCRQKGLTAYVMDMAEMTFPDGAFDAVYAMNSLLHLQKNELPGVLRRIDAVLKPGGLFFLGIYGGFDFEGIWEKDGYTPKRFFSFCTDARIQQEASAVFDILTFNRVITGAEDALHFQSLMLKKRARTGA